MLQTAPLLALALGTSLAGAKVAPLAPLAPLLVAGAAAAPRAPVYAPPAAPTLAPLAASAAGLPGLNPELGAELEKLARQLDQLKSNVSAVEAAAKPVAQSAIKAVDTIASFPQQVTDFKTKYQIPQNPTLTEEVQGVGRFVRDKLGISPEQASRTAGYLQSSPIYEQLKTPFQPANIMMAVGTTAGLNMLSQIQGGEGLDLGKAMSFVGEKSFWGGLAGSGVGYAVMSAVAMSMFPGGAGLVPVLAPMFAGMVGSTYGWQAGAGMFDGKSMGESLKALSPSTVLGQAAGSTVGMLIGAQVGKMVGGALGSVAGPVGAVAGAILMGQVGAKVGSAVKTLLGGDATEMNGALAEAGELVEKLKNAEKAVSEIVPPKLPAASLALGGDATELKAQYDRSYQDLQNALKVGNKAQAFEALQMLQAIAARYEQLVGRSLQSLNR